MTRHDKRIGMPTIRKRTAGTEHVHNVGRVSGGEAIDVDGDTAGFLVESGAYEYADGEQGAEVEKSDSEAQADSEGDGKTNAESIDDGVCPWCDEFDGESVGRHASAAHPDEWTDYKEANA